VCTHNYTYKKYVHTFSMMMHTLGFPHINLFLALLLHFVCISCLKVCSSEVCTTFGQKCLIVHKVCHKRATVLMKQSPVCSHRAHCAHIHTFCVHLLLAHRAHRAHHEHTVHTGKTSYKYALADHVFPFPGPRWLKKGVIAAAGPFSGPSLKFFGQDR
jgi:hypothetical protein